MVGGEDDRPLRGHVLAADPRQPEVEVEERLQDGPRRASTRSGSRPRSRARRCSASQWSIGPSSTRRRATARYSAHAWRSTRTRTLRGALAGAVAAGVWAAQQPLDKRVFGVDYDDAELLGKRGRPRRAPGPRSGSALHLANGALFGARLRQRRAALPLPPWARGPLAGAGRAPRDLAAGRRRRPRAPARDDLPRSGATPRAFAQATWRHLLFGAVLGELERRLNAPEAELPAVRADVSPPTATARSSTPPRRRRRPRA